MLLAHLIIFIIILTIFYSVLHVAKDNKHLVVDMVRDRLGAYYTRDVILEHYEWYKRYQ